MSKTKLKLVIWFFLGCLLLGVGLGILRFVSGLINYFSEGADAASVLNIVPNVPVDLEVEFEWLPDSPNHGREMEPFTRKLIQGQYMRGWLQWNISYLKGTPLGLGTYFNGPAFEAVIDSVNFAQEEGWIMAQTDLEHHVTLHFYSADGSIVGLTDHDVHVVEIIRDGNGEPITSRVIRADYDVVLMLLDGTWQVRHWVRKNAEVIDPAVYEPPQGGQDFVMRNGRNLTLNDQPFTIRGINYYPQDEPWEKFWANYDSAVVEADFELLHELGLNSVRVFIPYEWPTPPSHEEGGGHGAEEAVDEDEIEQYMRDSLDDLLALAEKYDLKVIVTLFDFRTDYQILVWPNADRQVDALVPYFAEHPAILAWDVKNEPDFDRDGNTPEMVDTWLGHIAYKIRQHDPNHLVTIGWATPENAQLLHEVVDFVSFHYYGPADELAGKMQNLQTAVSDKPIVMTEFGLPTYNSFFSFEGHSENEQAIYYSDIRKVLNETENGGYMAWTLYDFSSVSRHVGGGASQKHLGVIDGNGRLKAAAFLLAEEANFSIPQLSFADRFLKPVYVTALIGLGTMAVVGLLFVRRFRPSFGGWVLDPLAWIWRTF